MWSGYMIRLTRLLNHENNTIPSLQTNKQPSVPRQMDHSHYCFARLAFARLIDAGFAVFDPPPTSRQFDQFTERLHPLWSPHTTVPAERTDLPAAAPLSGLGTPPRRCSSACTRCWSRRTGTRSSALWRTPRRGASGSPPDSPRTGPAPPGRTPRPRCWTPEDSPPPGSRRRWQTFSTCRKSSLQVVRVLSRVIPFSLVPRCFKCPEADLQVLSVHLFKA